MEARNKKNKIYAQTKAIKNMLTISRNSLGMNIITLLLKPMLIRMHHIVINYVKMLLVKIA